MVNNKDSPHLQQITIYKIASLGTTQVDVVPFHDKLYSILKECGGCGAQTWDLILHNLLHLNRPFSLHQMMQ